MIPKKVFGRTGHLSTRILFGAAALVACSKAGESDPERAAAALNRGVEQCVRQLPHQYQWSYKRFRKRPAGEREIY